jgi:glucose/arabinose dehydrogenase
LASREQTVGDGFADDCFLRQFLNGHRLFVRERSHGPVPPADGHPQLKFARFAGKNRDFLASLSSVLAEIGCMQVMSSQSPAPKGPNGISGGPFVLVVAALTLALIWHWFPVNIAVAPSSARSAKDVDAIAARLTPPQGFTVNAYAIGLGQARVMVLTSKGDIILSSPPHRVLLIKADSDGDGRAEGVETLIDKLENPSGLFLDGDQLYIAEDSRVLRVGFDVETGKIARTPETILSDLPRNGMHWTRTIKKGPDGYLYVSIGASCNVCIETNPWRAGIIRFKPGEKAELYASGLRNTVGFDWQPGTTLSMA